MEVGIEMVRELDITDWEPYEIADMIEEEISTLFPGWKDLDPHKSEQQHSYDFNEEDDNNGPPFPSSCSPSHGSLCESSKSHQILCSHGISSNAYLDSLQGQLLNTEDAYSESSCSSSTNSDFDESLRNCPVARDAFLNMKTEEFSRFCPQENTIFKLDKKFNGFSGTLKGMSSSGQKKLSKVRSFMDIRSQLLSRALMQAMNKRRAAKTVGAVENIGFQDPC